MAEVGDRELVQRRQYTIRLVNGAVLGVDPRKGESLVEGGRVLSVATEVGQVTIPYTSVLLYSYVLIDVLVEITGFGDVGPMTTARPFEEQPITEAEASAKADEARETLTQPAQGVPDGGYR